MVWEKARVGGTPPPLFWGQRIQRKLEFLSKVLYRQVLCCAALFCRTSPEQAKIPQNRPNFRVFYIFGQNSGRRTPPPYFGAVETKEIGYFPQETSFCRLFEFWGKTAAKIIGVEDGAPTGPPWCPAGGAGGTHHARAPLGEVARRPPPHQADPPTACQAAPGAQGCPTAPAEQVYLGGMRQRRRGAEPGTTGHPRGEGRWGTTAQPPLPSPPTPPSARRAAGAPALHPP